VRPVVHTEFPKYLTSAEGKRALVRSAVEVDALGAGWFESRAEARLAANGAVSEADIKALAELDAEEAEKKASEENKESAEKSPDPSKKVSKTSK